MAGESSIEYAFLYDVDISNHLKRESLKCIWRSY
jgi:hypothetical protein